MVYGPWTTLEETCHAREWLAMMVFAGRSQGKHIFPISAALPNEIITVPSLFIIKAQATFRMTFYAHRLTIDPTHLPRSPSTDILFCVIYCHSKVFMVQATRLYNLICGLGNTCGLFLGT
jgi:hypothetical protein